MNTLANRLRRAREALHPHVTQEAAAKHFGVTRSTVNQWESGRTKPSEDRHAAISALYNITLDEITDDSGQNRPQIIRQEKIPIGGPVDLPIYSSNELTGGVWGADPTMIIANLARDTSRYSTSAFGIYCHGSQQSPAFEPRDLVVVDPQRPVAPGDDVVLVQHYQIGELTPFQGILRRLLAVTDTHWRVRQFNPARDYNLTKEEWPKALWVSGKYSR